jgi:hypothetical protein
VIETKSTLVKIVRE